MEYRPLRIKAELFPYDNIDIKPLMVELAKCGMIFPYMDGKTLCIQIVNFRKHQSPHTAEQGSTLQAPYMHQIPENIIQQNDLRGFLSQENPPVNDDAPNMHGTSTLPAALIPDSLLLIADTIRDLDYDPGEEGKDMVKGDYQSDELKAVCWAIEKKTGNKSAWQKKYWPIWNRAIANIGADRLIEAINNRDFYNIEHLVREPEDGMISWIEDLEMKTMSKDWQETKDDETIHPEVEELLDIAFSNKDTSGPSDEELRLADGR